MESGGALINTSATGTEIVLFTRDLRLHDNPTLQAALEAAEQVVPLFVLDEAILGSEFAAPNRITFLLDCLRDLDNSLRQRHSGLVVRRGSVPEAVAAVAAEHSARRVHVASDGSRLGVRREAALAALPGVEVVCHDETAHVVPPGAVLPQGKDHFAVFSPYHRRWSEVGLRPLYPAPERISSPRLPATKLPTAEELRPGARAPQLPPGGEVPARARMQGWLSTQVADYVVGHDDLAGDRTSRFSPYLHFGCLSPVELVTAAGRSAGGQAFVRQLAWRDFNLQLLAARPDVADVDYRPRGDRWLDDAAALAAWQQGQTGYPIVDAGMRQLHEQGWMHNRARMIVASFLTKTLYLDWRAGARFFEHHLLDADIANNRLNWQWVAGTGTDTRPNRVLNPLRQAERYDPAGDYVRRFVPELAHLPGRAIHEPWKRPLETLDYPEPIVDLAEGRLRFQAARDSG